ncbi:MAG: hypothetical protein MZV64_42395 [Ignavibacteriales bacterium]|nr:hypothetical protein [Ignavibacteriales bacterium]
MLPAVAHPGRWCRPSSASSWRTSRRGRCSGCGRSFRASARAAAMTRAGAGRRDGGSRPGPRRARPRAPRAVSRCGVPNGCASTGGIRRLDELAPGEEERRAPALEQREGREPGRAVAGGARRRRAR